MIAGVDGCKGGGWIAAVDLSGGATEIRGPFSFLDLLRQNDLKLIVIDIPIGLFDMGWRECDLAAQELLKPLRDKSVFLVPARSVVEASSYEEAKRLSREIHGKAPSMQAYSIFKRILDVDNEMTPSLQKRVREAHPEVCFAEMNGRKPLHTKKKDAEGQAERLGVLRPHFHDISKQVEAFGRRGLISDVIDAYACLWTARRVQQSLAYSLPSRPQRGSRDLIAEIVV